MGWDGSDGYRKARVSRVTTTKNEKSLPIRFSSGAQMLVRRFVINKFCVGTRLATKMSNVILLTRQKKGDATTRPWIFIARSFCYHRILSTRVGRGIEARIATAINPPSRCFSRLRFNYEN